MHIVISVISEAIRERQKAPRAYVYSGFGDFPSSRISQTLRTKRFRRLRRPEGRPNLTHIVISVILCLGKSRKRCIWAFSRAEAREHPRACCLPFCSRGGGGKDSLQFEIDLIWPSATNSENPFISKDMSGKFGTFFLLLV